MTGRGDPAMTVVAAILRAEQIAIFVAGSVAYLALGGTWWLGIPLLFAIDFSMVGYLAGPRLGAITYNAGHNLVIALLAFGIGWWADVTWLELFGALWVAHIGMDRSLGYGLKLPSDFRDTHLGRIGR
jgi:uncharacterized protein DUF4260